GLGDGGEEPYRSAKEREEVFFHERWDELNSDRISCHTSKSHMRFLKRAVMFGYGQMWIK
ncbi:hypothetical protein, partial [Chamaesiphon sp. VAR_48_metabat_135_sub]|uniref:hypothetical protein n=1 Tax=Chamaesiphon sp. VAR_48_metabat_135_sub TaxID=2964699 RepID=UPI00286BE17E